MNRALEEHWEQVYRTKASDQLSWTQNSPEASLQLIQSFHLPLSASIIDIGGGDSRLAECLLKEGYTNITVLDISATALQKAQERLGPLADRIKWIVSDITRFEPSETYDIWHDRAAFHFLTAAHDIHYYQQLLRKAATGFIAIGSFSTNGPLSCSGLPVKQYNDESLTALLQNDFERLNCHTEDHVTPWGAIQNFLFCSFKRKN